MYTILIMREVEKYKKISAILSPSPTLVLFSLYSPQ